MEQLSTYLRWLAFACLMVAILGFGVVFVIGYKPPTFGRVATIVLLASGALALFLIARHLDRKARKR